MRRGTHTRGRRRGPRGPGNDQWRPSGHRESQRPSLLRQLCYTLFAGVCLGGFLIAVFETAEGTGVVDGVSSVLRGSPPKRVVPPPPPPTEAVHYLPPAQDELSEVETQRRSTMEVFGVRQTLEDPAGLPVDFVVVLRTVTCTTRQTVTRMNALYRPRRIWFLSRYKHNCNLVVAFAPNVYCVHSSEVFPDFSLHKAHDVLAEVHGVVGDGVAGTEDAHLLDRPQALNKLYEQLLALGAARHLPGLTDHYVFWEHNIIPLSSRQQLFYDGAMVFVTGRGHGANRTAGAGKRRAAGFHQVCERLTGEAMLHPHRQFTPSRPTPLDDYESETWVSHHMVFNRRLVDAMLATIEVHTAAKRGSWMIEVLKELSTADYNHLSEGFSYAECYGSWLKRHHPQRIRLHMAGWEWWDSPPQPGVAQSQPGAGNGDDRCCMSASDLQAYAATSRFFVRYNVDELWPDECGGGVFNLEGVPEFHVDLPTPKRVSHFIAPRFWDKVKGAHTPGAAWDLYTSLIGGGDEPVAAVGDAEEGSQRADRSGAEADARGHAIATQPT